jgi:CelD/BcsL family acetyltransferase involved in cellulose biosynthesis
VDITLYESEAWFDDLADEWGDLLAGSDTDRIFSTLTWLSTWWDAYHLGDIWTLVVRDSDGRLVGAAPWFRTTEDDGAGGETRVVGAIGGVEVTDYVDVIVRRGCEESVFAALTQWLAAHQDAFDVIRIANIPGESMMITRWPEMLRATGFSVKTGVEDVCPVVRLPDDFLAYIAGLDKKNRHELRRKLRRATGKVEWYIVGPEHDLQAEMAVFLDLMAASSPDKAAFLQDEKQRRFFEMVVPKIAAQGWLQLAIMTVVGEPTAAYLNFDYGNRVMVYNSGYDPDAHKSLSPGIVLLGRLIEHAIAGKRDMFDFLQGDEAYKRDLGGQDTMVWWLEITRSA